jgi:alanine racemase
MLISAGGTTIHTQWVVATFFNEDKNELVVQHLNGEQVNGTFTIRGEEASELHKKLSETAELEILCARANAQSAEFNKQNWPAVIEKYKQEAEFNKKLNKV